MALAPSIIINLPGYPQENLRSAETVAVLRALTSAQFFNGQNIAVDGSAEIGDGGGGLYTWDDLSVLDDNGTTIIKPTDTPPLSAGRWILTGTDFIEAPAAAVQANLVAYQELIASGPGAAQMGFLQSGTGATVRTVEARLRDVVSVKDFGAIGDGFYHPLSERFASLAAAQAVYPFVLAVDGVGNAWGAQSLDWAGIQAALNEAARDVNRRGTVHLPVGYYILSDSLKMASFVTFEGDSQSGSVLHNQGVALAAPQIVNADPASFVGSTIRNIAFYGGTHAIKLNVSSEIAGCTFENLGMVLQTDKCFEANKQVQTSRFLNCIFDGNNTATNGFRSSAGANNANLFSGCNFLNFTGASIYIVAGTGNHFVACRFEGGGLSTDGGRTLQFNGIESMSFYGCYFEKTHEYLMEAVSSGPNIAFNNCEFIGPVTAGNVFVGYKTLADNVVSFGTNLWFMPTNAPGNSVLLGDNFNLRATIPSAASAAALVIPRSQRIIIVTGTTSVTSIPTVTSEAGRIITLVFAGVLTMTIGAGNLKLAGNFVTTANDTLTLFSDGTDWTEMSRSVN